MNTPKSMALGWGSLVLAAGVSFYYAKKGIDARRREQAFAGDRPTEKLDWQQRIAQQEREEQAAKKASEGILAASSSAASGLNSSAGLSEKIDTSTKPS